MAKTEIKTFEVISTIEETTNKINKWAKDEGMIIYQVMPIVTTNEQHVMVVFSKEQIYNF